ncbi:neuroserpin-like [Bicyclus anynana]|uniref:Neuroserpin-like n=1 Tax=Bicyclus anynana TaxID=110368 RepID=A0A6J1NI63_BICAN|nr:neuroserpin-like [Bicyclus anynana]
MILKTISLVFLLTLVQGSKYNCNPDNVVEYFKRSTYDFAVRILDRVGQQTDFDFVFSPLSTWLQLMTLAEGATGDTLKEIREVTGVHPLECFRRKFKEILNTMEYELRPVMNRSSVIAIDKLLGVKDSFVKKVKTANTDKIVLLNFHDQKEISSQINKIGNPFDANDFELTDFLMTSTAYLKSYWCKPFNPVYTMTEMFYSEENVPIGQVRLMHQEEYFNLTELPSITAKVLELPLNSNNRLSMLVFIPTNITVMDLFYQLKYLSLSTIFNRYEAEGTKLVKVKLPRFKITTELLNLAELVNDMDVNRIFYPEVAEFGGISDYPMYVSLMSQIADIEVTETGVQASDIAESLIREPANSITFSADRPFAYIIVDRPTETILFGGIYGNPSIY